MTYRAVVTRVAAGVAYVRIPQRGALEYGPCQTYLPTSPALAATDKVLVTDVNGFPDDLVIIARMG